MDLKSPRDDSYGYLHHPGAKWSFICPQDVNDPRVIFFNLGESPLCKCFSRSTSSDGKSSWQDCDLYGY
ncbi:hypothetical protein TNCT_379311 [Trichonephila clavata]|uniref:Uncharacterized protein n=1 Tax=Trichonephila clavata TaxID=2740835 RepID=A0A8X6K3H9_TRICU|nr:hypothetical protein TNCT_379311 [Trichonephila clavata]